MEVLILIGLLLYFLPTIVAESWKKQNADAIFLLNFLLGWTLIGWVISFVWAASSPKITHGGLTSCPKCGGHILRTARRCSFCHQRPFQGTDLGCRVDRLQENRHTNLGKNPLILCAWLI